MSLDELVAKDWLSLADTKDLVYPLLHHNARPILNFAEKAWILQNVPWS